MSGNDRDSARSLSRRFRRIVEDYLQRPGGDYAELLRRGQVSSADGVDAEEWRAEIRAKARADKISVITIRGDRAIATRQRSIPKDQERPAGRRGGRHRGGEQQRRALGERQADRNTVSHVLVCQSAVRGDQQPAQRQRDEHRGETVALSPAVLVERDQHDCGLPEPRVAEVYAAYKLSDLSERYCGQ